MERVMGIEPTYSAWKAAALPLSYTRDGSGIGAGRPWCKPRGVEKVGKPGKGGEGRPAAPRCGPADCGPALKRTGARVAVRGAGRPALRSDPAPTPATPRRLPLTTQPLSWTCPENVESTN